MRAWVRFFPILLSILLSNFLVAGIRPARAADSSDLPHNDLPHNSISLDGLNEAAPFLDALANGALDDATLQTVAASHPVNPNISKLLGKIVSCALGPGKRLQPVGGRSLEDGQLGLCPEWAAAPLSPARKPACLQLVSSCVLARVNAVGARIILSLRAADERLSPLRDRVPVEDQYRENHGTPIPSFQACAANTPGGDCGFHPLNVGRCIAGRHVKITSAKAGATIRVCKGLYGCEAPVASPPPAPVRAYAGFLEEGVHRVQFTCPANGPRRGRARRGYYSVMIKPATGGAPIIKVTASSGVYPAPEKDVFTWAEGAFYGNLFDTGRNRNPKYQAADQREDQKEGQREGQPALVLAGDEHVCFGSDWVSGVAQMNDRFCAQPGTDCFVNKPMPCFHRLGDRCARDAVSGKAFASCKPTSAGSALPLWKRPLTTYLNNPCDLSSDQACDPDKLVKRQRPPREKEDDDDNQWRASSP